MAELSPATSHRRASVRAALTFKWSSDAALRAVRAAVIIPGLFAITLEGIGNLQMATLTAFGQLRHAGARVVRRQPPRQARRARGAGGFGQRAAGDRHGRRRCLLGGGRRGPPCTWTAFPAVLYAGIAGPNAASAATAALLAYVLPAASAAPMSVVGDRLAGWLLASVVGTAAVLATSPREERDPLRPAASRLAARIADQLDAALGGATTSDRRQAAIDAKHEMIARFSGAVYKPTGLAAPAEGLASVIELLEWCTSLVTDMANEGLDLRRAAAPDRELFAAATAVLRDVSALLVGGAATPDLERIGRIHGECLNALLARPPDGGDLRDQARISFHANTIAVAVRTIGADALLAAELADSEWFADERRWLFGISAGGSLVPRRASRLAAVARRDASLGSCPG